MSNLHIAMYSLKGYSNSLEEENVVLMIFMTWRRMFAANMVLEI